MSENIGLNWIKDVYDELTYYLVTTNELMATLFSIPTLGASTFIYWAKHGTNSISDFFNPLSKNPSVLSTSWKVMHNVWNGGFFSPGIKKLEEMSVEPSNENKQSSQGVNKF